MTRLVVKLNTIRKFDRKDRYWCIETVRFPLLALSYNVLGKQVILSQNQQVKRKIGKFPERYMFQLTQDEHDRLRSHFVILKRG